LIACLQASNLELSKLNLRYRQGRLHTSLVLMLTQ